MSDSRVGFVPTIVARSADARLVPRRSLRTLTPAYLKAHTHGGAPACVWRLEYVWDLLWFSRVWAGTGLYAFLGSQQYL